MFKTGDRVINTFDGAEYEVFTIGIRKVGTCQLCGPEAICSGVRPIYINSSNLSLKDNSTDEENTKMSAPQETLQDAVQAVINNFIDNNQSFSIHNITRTIRDDVNNGDLEIPECEVRPGYFEILHDDVRGAFNSLNTSSLTRVFDQRGFFVYSGTPATVNKISNIPGFATVPVSTVNITAPVKLDQSTIASRVGVYLTNAKARGFQPTLKQVQSAIKRGHQSTGWTIEELAPIVAQLNA